MIITKKIEKIISSWVLDSKEYNSALKKRKDLVDWLKIKYEELLTPKELNWVEKYSSDFIIFSEPIKFYRLEELCPEKFEKFRKINSYFYINSRGISPYISGMFYNDKINPSTMLNMWEVEKFPKAFENLEELKDKHEDIFNELVDKYIELNYDLDKLSKKVEKLVNVLCNPDLNLTILKKNYVELYNYLK